MRHYVCKNMNGTNVILQPVGIGLIVLKKYLISSGLTPCSVWHLDKKEYSNHNKFWKWSLSVLGVSMPAIATQINR